jgi:hypothetical protein
VLSSTPADEPIDEALLDEPDRQAEHAIDRSHPFGVALCQIVVEREERHGHSHDSGRAKALRYRFGQA